MKIQPAVRTETVRIAMGTAFFSLVMLLVFALLGRLDVTVVLGSLWCAGAAIRNFFLMALSVQRAAESMNGVTLPPEPLADQALSGDAGRNSGDTAPLRNRIVFQQGSSQMMQGERRRSSSLMEQKP